MDLKFPGVEVKQQNIVLRNVRMFIGMMPQELIRLRNHVNDVAKYSMTIPVILKDGNFVRMNVRIKKQLEKKCEYVDIVGNLLRLIHRRQIFVVRGSVVLPDQKVRIGQHEQKFFDSAFNVVKNFGKHLLQLNDGLAEENSVLANVRLNRKKYQIYLRIVFTVLVSGFRREKGFFCGIIQLAGNAVLTVMGFTSTTRNSNEMAEQRMMEISLPFVCNAT